MKKTIETPHWYFVDEAGDPTFYDAHGNFIVGQEGCSPILLLGFIETADPHPIRQSIEDLHIQVAADTFLQAIPSSQKTNRSFHAKDDAPEVRYFVYKALANLDYKATFVVARKIERLFRTRHHARENEFYDDLISRLFTNVLHRYTPNHIYFSRRGNRLRQKPLEEAIQRGVARFEQRWSTKVNTAISIDSQTPTGESCLQVVDYMNWAVYRAFVKREMRFFQFVESKVSCVVDMYDFENSPKNWYHRRNPFNIEKTSPL